MTFQFPDGFTWGTATAAHQIEGNNVNSDFWLMEHTPGTLFAEPSGDACDSFHRYPDDIRLVRDLGFQAYRFSIEWARIEPEEGQFSRAALDHYRRMLACCLEHGVRPCVTFHHFTSPRWFTADGGWEVLGNVDRFLRYCERTVRHLGDLIDTAYTINEANLLATLAMQDYQALPGGEARRDAARRASWDPFLDAARQDDLLGVQTYSRVRFDAAGPVGPEPGVPVLIMGYEFWPEALEETIRYAADRAGVPIYVTENGIGTTDDAQRQAYVQRALTGVSRCLRDGLDVRGYFYWSLMDNFEWLFGYAPQFGIVAVDRATQRRSPKASAAWLGAIARANAVEV